MTNTHTTDLSATYRVTYPGAPYLPPADDRWAFNITQRQWHRFATLILTDENREDYPDTTLCDSLESAYRDCVPRCAAFSGSRFDFNPSLAYLPDYAHTADTVCMDCAALDSAVSAEPAATVTGSLPTMDDLLTVPALVPLHNAEPLRIGTNGLVSVGRAAVYAARYGIPHAWQTVTLSDLIAYWHDRHDAYWRDMTYVGRTLRAAARGRGWDHHYDRYVGDMYAAGHDLPTVIRPNVDRRTTIDATSNNAHVNPRGYMPPMPPADAYAVHSAATVVDVVNAVRALEDSHADGLSALSDMFITAARAQGWCHEYEQTVDELNNGLSTYAGSPFQVRERNYRVEGTVRVYVDVPWSQYVTADSEDSARDNVDLYDIDVDDYLSGMRMSDLSYTVEHSTADIDDIVEDD